MLSAIPSIIHIGIYISISYAWLLPGPDALTAVSLEIRRILLIINSCSRRGESERPVAR
jgi:hypothetical protein